MEMTREQFLQQQQVFATRSAQTTNEKNVVPWFKIEPEEEVIVRFAYKNLDDLKFYSVHEVLVDGKTRAINCIRDYREDTANCPLCESGDRPKQKMFVQLFVYRPDETGKIVPQACVWKQSAHTWMAKLNTYFAEYPDLVDNLFKIKRTGQGLNTKYSEVAANPKVYKNEDYPYDMSIFDNYTPLGTWALQDLSYEEMNKHVHAQEPVRQVYDL